MVLFYAWAFSTLSLYTNALLRSGCIFGVGSLVGCTFLGSAAPKIVPHAASNLCHKTKTLRCIAKGQWPTVALNRSSVFFSQPPPGDEKSSFSLFCALSFAADDSFLPSSFLVVTRALCAISIERVCVCVHTWSAHTKHWIIDPL